MDSERFLVHVGADDPALADLLDREIYAFNADTIGVDDGRMLTIRLDDGSGQLAGGLSGWTWAGCGYVDVLWVAADHRGRGLGTLLMDTAEREAISRGCSVMALSSHSFQAPDFYRRRGYVETGRTEDYPVAYAQLHMRKELIGHQASSQGAVPLDSA